MDLLCHETLGPEHVSVLGEVLGEGAYGKVCACTCEPGCPWVVKTWEEPEEALDELLVQERLPESPHVLRGERAEVGPGSLAMRMRRMEKLGRVPLEQALRGILRGVAALAAADLCHCDIKASNLARDPDTGEIVLLDFGNAFDFRNPVEPFENVFRCTEHTRPPETNVHRRSDVWSAAMAAIEVSCGYGFMYRHKKDVAGMLDALGAAPRVRRALEAALVPDPELRDDAEGVLRYLQEDDLAEVPSKKRKLESTTASLPGRPGPAYRAGHEMPGRTTDPACATAATFWQARPVSSAMRAERAS